jgi:uncharacterized protein
MTMFRRFMARKLLASLQDTPVVLLIGARQTGKSTLVQEITKGEHSARYITLDDATFLAAAANDPTGFLEAMLGPVIIDEVQHAPGLFPAIKATVDRDRTPGRFLLTGSANVLLLPKISESLAGRMEILTLWPLSQAEIEGAGSGFIDILFTDIRDMPATVPSLDKTGLIERILASGYPEPLARESAARRRAWFSSYLTSILTRDVRDVANIEGLTEMPRLLAVLASRMSELLNVADISRNVGIPYTTLHRYMSLLQTIFLVQLLPAWSTNLGVGITKSPKLLFNDTGLAASFIGVDADRLMADGTLFGHLLENFAIMEIIKAIGVSTTSPSVYHYRTTAGVEVDLVLEAPDGRLIAFEVKASSTVTAKDFKGLRSFSAVAGEQFKCGIVIYTGRELVPFGGKFFALPLQTLWSL